MRRALFALALSACAEPPPSTPPVSTASDGVHVQVGGRDVVVHCVLSCDAMGAELTRLSEDCARSPTSGPHRIAQGGALLRIACCQEAALAYDRACGHETLTGCASHWQASCEGVTTREAPIDDDSRGVTGARGIGP